MRVTCTVALLLRCFTREVKVLPGAKETGIGEKLTEKANKHVAEVLKQQQQPGSTHKRKATVYEWDTCKDWKIRFGQRDNYGFHLILV